MFCRGDHSLALESFDPIGRHLSGEIGILSIVFKVPPVQRCPCDIHTGTKLNMDATDPGFAPQCLPVEQCEVSVPGRRKGNAAGKRAGRAVRPDSLGAVSHDQLGNPKPWNGDRGHPVKAIPGEKADLLIESQFVEQLLSPRLDLGGRLP